MRNPFKRLNKRKSSGCELGQGRHSFHFRCRESGVYPVDYEITSYILDIMDKMEMEINQKIRLGTVDEYTSPDIFDELLDAYLQLMKNDIEKQALKHGLVIGQIEDDIRTALQMERGYQAFGEKALEEYAADREKEREDDGYER